jgi:ABC-2 type transport system permease protein
MTTRPFYWSVRRELWENRSIYVAPLIVTGFVLFGSLIRVITLPRRLQALPADDPAKLHAALIGPFSVAPAPIMFATIIVGLYYALDALYGERRDRSILFWKSLPVSDLTTVLSKASIPLVVLPLIAFVLSVATTAFMLVVGSAVLSASPVGPGRLWAELRYFQQVFIMFYGLTVHALWFAPIYGWLMLVSAWARRAPFLWAVLPLFAVSAVERVTFNTSYFVSMLGYRFIGAMREAFILEPGADGDFNRITQLDPLRFLTSPGLWLGLVLAAAFFAAAVRLRRHRDPI